MDRLRDIIRGGVARLRPSRARGSDAVSGMRLALSPAPALELDTWYEAHCGRRIPVFRRYRYSVKKGWLFFDSLFALNLLRARGCLDEAEIRFLESCHDHRTLARPLAEIDRFAAPVLARHAQMFVPGTLDGGRRPVERLDARSLARAIERQRAGHAATFGAIAARGVRLPGAGVRVLEVGFTTGISPMGLAWLGYRAFAVDNGHGDPGRESTAAGYFSDVARSDVSFAFGDITGNTPWEDGFFDLICSSSVLEHIRDLPAALREMRRLLRPDGLVVHRYNPYFCPNGGHALGIPDMPWGHVRMDEGLYLRYLDALRPHEAERARAWLTGALTRDYPIGRVQAAVAASGLDLELWEETPAPAAQLRHLGTTVIDEALGANPGITVSDLVATNILLVARKPAGGGAP